MEGDETSAHENPTLPNRRESRKPSLLAHGVNKTARPRGVFDLKSKDLRSSQWQPKLQNSRSIPFDRFRMEHGSKNCVGFASFLQKLFEIMGRGPKTARQSGPEELEMNSYLSEPEKVTMVQPQSTDVKISGYFIFAAVK